MNNKFTTLTILALLLCLIRGSEVKINQETRRFTDSQNRERYFHGVNVVVKHFPYIPRVDSFDPISSFTEEDMANLESWGLNAIRLGTQWPGVEPVRDQYNETYIEILKSIVQKSAKHNIFALMDFHQDVLNEQLCGEGIPGWAVRTHTTSLFSFPRPLQASSFQVDDKTKVPSDADCSKHDWASYHMAFNTGYAYQSLYDNTDGIQDSFSKFWRKIAENFKDESNVLGYELINEPFAGNPYGNPLRMIPGWADKYNLQPMYDKTASKIREVDNNTLIFFESVTWDDFFKIGFDHPPGGASWADKSVISYHYYSNVNFNQIWQLNARQKDSQRLGVQMMCTEFAICDDGEDPLRTSLENFDNYLQSWLGWSYKPYADITGDCGNIYFQNGTINTQRVKTLSRTYAQAVAGKTISMNFNENDKEFRLIYQVCPECGETEIYLNEELHYPNGYLVTVRPEGVLDWKSPKKNRLHFSALATTNSGATVQIDISSKPN